MSTRTFDECSTALKQKKEFKDTKETEAYLQSLLKEREILVGDFYGINITAYRYVNVFYRLGYIRYKIKEIDEEIARVKKLGSDHVN